MKTCVKCHKQKDDECFTMRGDRKLALACQECRTKQNLRDNRRKVKIKNIEKQLRLGRIKKKINEYFLSSELYKA